MLQRRRLRCRARSNHFPCFNHTQAVVTATMFAELTYVKKIYQFTLLLLLLLLLSYAFQLSILGCASKEAQSPNFKPFAICHFNLSLDSMEPFSHPIKPFWNWTITDHVKLSLGAQRVETKWQLKNFETAECGWMDGCALWSMGEPSLRNIHWPLLPPLKQHKQESTSLFRSVVCALHDTNGPEQTNEWTPE